MLVRIWHVSEHITPGSSCRYCQMVMNCIPTPLHLSHQLPSFGQSREAAHTTVEIQGCHSQYKCDMLESRTLPVSIREFASEASARTLYNYNKAISIHSM